MKKRGRLKPRKPLSEERRAYLERYHMEPPVKTLKLSRTHRVRRSPLPGVFSALHSRRLAS